jgi:hypothetical protein
MAIAIANNAVSKKGQTLFERGFKSWCENTSIGMRIKLGLNPHDSLDASELAKRLNVEVMNIGDINDLPLETLTYLSSPGGNDWSAVTVSLGESRIIVINPRHSVGRTSSDLMHELAHIILRHAQGESHYVGDLMMREYNEKQEAEADWLAGSLLLPRKALEFTKYSKMDEDSVLTKYKVSKQLYDFRCHMTAVNRQYGHQRR